jgi:hypothetical protein
LHELKDLLQAHSHEEQNVDSMEIEEFHDAQDTDVSMEMTDVDDAALLVNAAKSSTKLQPGDIRHVMSNASKRYTGSSKKSNDGKGKLHIKMHVTYHVLAHCSHVTQSLVDCGANGGVAGNDVHMILKMHQQVDIQGINNHQVTNIDIGMVGGVVKMQHGPVIVIMHQYALFGKGALIHSPGQLEWYKNSVDDKLVHVGGLQHIKTLDGYLIPLAVKNGLPCMDI